ncbi:hypothetical protein [Sulfurovum sp. TSL1]|uniref:hypothetical protein n=1 Tax=Sulfurovum sp. TSL1 TaxID=2826994 RepID=UPI001CC4A47A|nr:hypothetical protein [Sulfurovum sp. TSL1]GIT97992.1 hypothetical protein TSL1_08130 [Sulfurovum sp. TSL1]
MKFKKVELHAFRAYKDKEFGTFDFTLENDKIANLVSIYAPNGFGKTSFYDGIEWGITGNISRLRKLYADAKSINDSNIKPFILQNNEIDINTDNGSVNIETTIGVYSKEIKKVHNSITSDYIFNKQKIEHKYFQDVILSQDGIDNFLKAADDKERYKKFIDYFGDKGLEKYHTNISEVEYINNKKINDINKEIEEIKIILKEPVNPKVFDFTNEKIKELNKQENIFDFINKEFDEVKKLALDSQLSEQKTIVSQKIEKIQDNKEKLSQEWEDRVAQFFHNKQNYKSLQDKLSDYQKLQQADKSIQFLNQELEKFRHEKEKLENLQKIYPQYHGLLDSIDLKHKELEKKNKSKKVMEELLIVGEGQLKHINEQIKLTEENKKTIEDFKESVPNVYYRIDYLQNVIQDLKKLKDVKSRLNSQKNSIENNIFIEIRNNEKYINDVIKIDELIDKNAELQQSLHSIHEEQKVFDKYHKDLKELISLGVNLIDEKQSDTCPLCSTKQDSYEILKSKVLKNSFLSDTEQKLLVKKQQINLEQTQNNKQIQEIKKLFLNDLDKILQNVVQDLKFINYEDQQLSDEVLQNKINKYEEERRTLLVKIEDKPKEALLTLKNSELEVLTDRLNEYRKTKNDLEIKISNNKIENSLINVNIETINNEINSLKQKEEYQLLNTWLLSFDKSIDDIQQELKNNIELVKEFVEEKKQKLITDTKTRDETIKKYKILDLNVLDENIKKQQEILLKLQANISSIESQYLSEFKKEIKDIETAKVDIQRKIKELQKSLDEFQNKITTINTLEENTTKVFEFIQQQNKRDKLEKLKEELKAKNRVSETLSIEKSKLEKKIEKDVQAFFYEDLINQIYEKIDPHPDYKNVQFKCEFENGVGKLNVFVSDEKGEKHISPSLYYSTAQLNVLSLSIFLAKALNAHDGTFSQRGESIDCIFIDDPIQAMDSINILATIDLLRSLVVNYDKQIILSTHDENFHRLLEKKIPTEYFNSKFIELESFGKIKLT